MTIRLIIGALLAVAFMWVLRAVWLPTPQIAPAGQPRTLRSARPRAVLAVALLVLVVALIADVVMEVLGVGDPLLILNKYFVRGLVILVAAAVAAAWATKPSRIEFLLGATAGLLLIAAFLFFVH